MKMMRVYIDTSVFGGYYDEEFQTATQGFFAALSQGRIAALISATLVRELEDAPGQVRGLLRNVMVHGYEPLEVTDEAVNLAKAYIQAGVVTEKYSDDALHVAMATLARADVIVSWNFKHIVNPVRERAFNGVNIALGYGIVSVMTPEAMVKVMEAQDED